MEREIIIIADREASSMTSRWREYLCLRRGVSKRYQIFTGGYQSLADASDYFNEEDDCYEIPDVVDGKIVSGIEDEWIVGGELDYYDDIDQIEFDHIDDPALLTWLVTQQWKDDLPLVVEAITRLISVG